MTRPLAAMTERSGAGDDPLSLEGDDALLVRRARHGDAEAFGVLVRRYQRPMASLVARFVAPGEVDDVLQEVFLRAWNGLPRFRGDARFSTWLYRIAVNTASKHRKRLQTDGKRRIAGDDLTGGMEQLAAQNDASPDAGGDPQAGVERQERDSRIRTAVAALPEKQRTVVLLHYFEGRSCEEIGGIVGCSVGTVWSRLHYACKRLKDSLTDL